MITIIENVNELPSGKFNAAAMSLNAAKAYPAEDKYYIKWRKGGMLFLKVEQ